MYHLKMSKKINNEMHMKYLIEQEESNFSDEQVLYIFDGIE